MKLFIFLLVVIFCTSCTSTLYIVRHAEKSTEPTKDPYLTDAGKTRAQNLASVLSNKNIQSIYSTPTNRTKQTAEPLSTSLDIPIIVYKTDTVVKVLKNIFLTKKNTLVVGHSNTLLPMLDSMKISYAKKEVPDWEYDNLIVVKYRKFCFDCTQQFVVKKVTLTKYGIPSVSNSTTPIMQKN